MMPNQTPGYSSQDYPFQQQPEPASFQSTQPYAPPPDPSSGWAYPPNSAPVDRSGNYTNHASRPIPQFSQSGAPQASTSMSGPPPGNGWHPEGHVRAEPEAGYRGWPVEAQYHSMGEPSGHTLF